MTLSDLLKLLKRYLKFVIAVPLVCAIATALYFSLIPKTYEARASFLTSGDLAIAGGIAQTEAAKYTQNGITVYVGIDNAYSTIRVSSAGNDYDGCIAAVNATVLAAANATEKADKESTVSTLEATSALDTSPSVEKNALLALLAGLFGAICIVVVLDIVKAPIKTKFDIQAASDVPVIGIIPGSDHSERLLANVRFAADGIPKTIAVVPVGYTGASLACSELASAFDAAHISATRIQGNPHAQGLDPTALSDKVTIIECAPVSDGMGAVYIAKEAEITVLCASEWRDNRRALVSLVEELQFAKANIGGAVLLASGFSD